ncbi:hypothetical protein VULLAG_LOCUS2075 [Vulpes lagopus]
MQQVTAGLVDCVRSKDPGNQLLYSQYFIASGNSRFGLSLFWAVQSVCSVMENQGSLGGKKVFLPSQFML